jgi:hypothetical protein
MRTTEPMPVSTAEASREPRNTDIGSGVPRTRLRTPCSRAVATPKITAVYVAVVIAKTAIDGVKNCAKATLPPSTLTFESLSASNMTRSAATPVILIGTWIAVVLPLIAIVVALAFGAAYLITGSSGTSYPPAPATGTTTQSPSQTATTKEPS